MSISLAKKIFAGATVAATVLSGVAPFVAKAAPHAAGTNVNYNGTIWMIMGDGTRRAYTSAGAFLSYGFNSWASVVPANSDDLALPAGASYIPPQDGSIFCATETKGTDVKNECAVLTGSQKASFVSEPVFRGLGYNFGMAIYGDSSFLTRTSNVESASEAHRPGALINKDNTIYLVGQNGLLGIPDLATFNSWGYSFSKVVPANAADRAMSQTGVMAARVPGQLSPTGTVTPPTTGSVTVAAASNTPASATIPQGSTNVKYLTFTVANGSGSAGTINGITVSRTGAGTPSDFSNVYIYNGDERLTSGRTINTSTNQAIFNGMNVTVPAYGSVTLSILADMSTTAGAGNVHILSVSGVTLASGTASGAASGNAMTVASADAGTVTVTKSGSISNPKVGQTNVKVAEFQIAAGSAEDLTLKRVTLYQGGSLSRTNLLNLKLMQNAVQVGTGTFDARDHVAFSNLNFNMDRGNTRTFEVYADIAGTAKKDETIRLYVEDSSDIYAQGRTFGFGATVTSTAYDNGSADGTDASWSTIEGGQLTFAFTGPASTDIARGVHDAEVFTFTAAAQSQVEIRQLSLLIDGGSGTANLLDGTTPLYTDIKIWDTSTNTVVWGPLDVDTGSDTSEDLLFTEDVVLPAGSSKTYKVTMDVSSSTAVVLDDDIRFSLDVSDFTSQVKNLDNNTFLAASEIVPGSDLVGNTHVIKVASLTVSLANTPTTATYIKGTNDVAFVGFNLQAGTGADVKVTSIKITCYIDDSNVQADFVKGEDTDAGGGTTDCQETVPSVKLMDGTTQIGDTKSPGADTDGTMTFGNLNLTVTKGTTKTIKVVGNISASAYRNSNVERVGFDIVTAATDLTTSDPQGNDVTETGDAVNGATSPNRIITVENSGTLTASLAPAVTDLTDSRIVTAGKTHTLTEVKWTAANEEMKITKMRVNIVSAAAAADVSDSITGVWLYDGATLVAGPFVPNTGCASGTLDACVDFNAINFVVPKDGTKVLTIKADLNTISGGADSGDEFSLDVDFDTNFEARGTAGSTTLTSISSAAADVSGNDVVLRKSQPRIELVSLPTTILTNGTMSVLKFKVTAVDGDVSLKHIDFSTVVSDDAGITLSAPAVRETGTGIDITSVVSITDGATTPSNVTFTSEQQIASGTSKTYEFRVNIAGAGSADTIATQITGDTGVVTGELDDTDATINADLAIDDMDGVINVGNDSAAPLEYNFIWSDVSGSLNAAGTYSPTHNDAPDEDALDDGGDDTASSNDWTNGRYIRVVPTDTQSLSFPS